MNYPVQVLGIGKSLPDWVVFSTDIDQQQNLALGTTQRLTGLSQRRFLADGANADELTRQSIQEALDDAGLVIDEIDCIINASATPRQAIPYNAAATLRLLSPNRLMATFDINMTCLGVLRAFDLAARLFDSYPRILIVSCDIASVGLDWSNVRTAGGFSDSATAMVVSRSQAGGILHSAFTTYTEGYEYCVIRGGGYQLHPHNYEGDYSRECYFEMDGKKLYKLNMQVLPKFVHNQLAAVDLRLSDIDWIVPHQASRAALDHMVRLLEINPSKLIDIFQSHGNQIASSIPSALYTLMRSGKLQTGHKVLLIGTSAGMSLGMVIWEVP